MHIASEHLDAVDREQACGCDRSSQRLTVKDADRSENKTPAETEHRDLPKQPALLMRAAEVARELGLGRSKVYEMMAKGELADRADWHSGAGAEARIGGMDEEHTNSAA